MKFNWGWGIAIFVAVFVTFISNLVYRCTQQKIDLVSEKYYEKEIQYQQHINRELNSRDLGAKISLVSNDSVVVIHYPEVNEGNISGDIEFFKPDDANKDVKVVVDAGIDRRQSVDINRLSKGWWDVKINWSAGGTPYYFEQRIFVN